MKAQSSVYIKLQNLYKDKARSDAKEVLANVRSTPGGEDVDPAEIELFCTNARFIKLINGADGGAKTLPQITGKSKWLACGMLPELWRLSILTIPLLLQNRNLAMTRLQLWPARSCHTR